MERTFNKRSESCPEEPFLLTCHGERSQVPCLVRINFQNCSASPSRIPLVERVLYRWNDVASVQSGRILHRIVLTGGSCGLLLRHFSKTSGA